MRLFELRRDVDETGVSGTGTVAQGVIFDNGWCALTWLTAHTSAALYTSIAEVVSIHGHDGKTRVVQIVDADPKRWVGLVATAYQDECENVGVDFDKPNHRDVWVARHDFARLFDLVEFKVGPVAMLTGTMRERAEVEAAVQDVVDEVAAKVAPDLEPPKFSIDPGVVKLTDPPTEPSGYTFREKDDPDA